MVMIFNVLVKADVIKIREIFHFTETHHCKNLMTGFLLRIHVRCIGIICFMVYGYGLRELEAKKL